MHVGREREKNAELEDFKCGVSGDFGLDMSGCKSAPDLTAAQALSMVQAKYDQTPPVGVNILVNDPGMLAGGDGEALGSDEDLSEQDLGRFQADSRGEEGSCASRRRRCD